MIQQDIQYGFRTLLKNPAFTVLSVLTLALGIGANTAIFSVVNAVLLRPLPFLEAERLVAVQNRFLALGLKSASASVADFYDYRKQTHIFEDVAAVNGNSFNLTGLDRAELVMGAETSASLFAVLGVKPLLGRVFTEEEDQPGRGQVVVLDEGLWRRRFGADPNILGRTLRLNDRNYTVIGVIPQTLGFFARLELWAPAAFTSEQKSPARRGNQYLFIIARLKRGISLEQARAGMNTFSAGLAKEFPDNYPPTSGWGIRVDLLSELLVGEIRPALLVLLAAVGFVLLIASANVANLLLARATARLREMSIRTALGAGRWRIVRQLLTESTLLGLLGGAAGLLLGRWGVHLLVQASPENFPRLHEIEIDPRVLAFTLGISLLTGFLFGLAPAIQVARANLHDALKESARGTSGGLRRHKMRSALVVGEVALSLVLLIGAGLMIQSFARLQRVDTGFRPDNVLTFRVALPATRYPALLQTAAFFQQLIGRVQNLPGVTSAGANSTLPFSGSNSSGSFSIEGRDVLPGGTGPHADIRVVSPGYFAAMGIPLRRGRMFADTDKADALGAALVDEKLAKQYWPNEDPIGKRVRRGGPQAPWFTIAGIVGHVKHAQLDSESKGVLYFSYLQNRAPSMTLVVRTASDPKALAGAVPGEVSALDKDLPVFEVKTMEQRLRDSLTPQRISIYLLTVFSSLALVLAAVGIYGVMSQSVTQRTHEIGIRMALGAADSNVRRMVVGQAMTLVVIGLGIGLIAAIGVTRLISKLLFGIKPTDPATFAGVALVLIVVSILASYLPARRATRVDPMVALRYE